VIKQLSPLGRRKWGISFLNLVIKRHSERNYSSKPAEREKIGFNEDKIKEILNVPKNKRIEFLITMGYPAKEAMRNKIRKQLSQVFSYNKYE